MSLKSGTLVTLHPSRDDRPIKARRVPEALRGPRNKVLERVLICDIPEGTTVLYMSSQNDAFNTALRAKGTGPFGYTPVQIIYHFVLWGDRPVWVSSEDTVLKPI